MFCRHISRFIYRRTALIQIFIRLNYTGILAFDLCRLRSYLYFAECMGRTYQNRKRFIVLNGITIRWRLALTIAFVMAALIPIWKTCRVQSTVSILQVIPVVYFGPGIYEYKYSTVNINQVQNKENIVC